MSRTATLVLLLAALILPAFHSTAQAAPTGPRKTPRRSTIVARIIDLVNTERLAAGLPPLTVSTPLVLEAQRFSAVQADMGTLSHRGNDGTTAGQRLTNAGYSWSFYGENLAAGQTTADDVVSAWMNSPDHRANMLSPKATEIGVGHTTRLDDPSRFVNYYVLEIGRAR